MNLKTFIMVSDDERTDFVKETLRSTPILNCFFPDDYVNNIT